MRNSALTYYNLTDFFPSFLYNLCSFVTNRHYPPTVSGQKMTSGCSKVRGAVPQKTREKGVGRLQFSAIFVSFSATFGPKLFQSPRHLDQFIKVVINERHWFQDFTIDEYFSSFAFHLFVFSVVDL